MLHIDNLHAFYGKSHVLHGVRFDVGPGEIVALLGRNGSGRSTTAKAIMGMVESRGEVNWKGQDISGRKPYEIAHLGLGYVPENRDIFPRLTVHQNLMLGQKSAKQKGRWSFDDMYGMFPRLKERQHTEAGVLSGGEQQMLTICRTLMGNPDLIMVDEPTEGRTLVAVEHDMGVVFGLADRIAVLVYGEVIAFDTPEAVRANRRVQEAYLGSVVADQQAGGH